MAGGFPWCGRTVMTVDAIPGNGCMIDIGSGPAIGRVAGITIAIGGNVVIRFARGRTAVMAIGTAAGNRTMVNIDLCPAVADVTTVATVGRCNVTGRLTRCGTAVMAS